MVTTVGAVVAAPTGQGMAASQWQNITIASVAPAPGQRVGVAHPVVVTFGSPVLNRLIAERTVTVRSTPPMTGRFEWLDDDVLQWVPDRFWPAHSTITLSVGGLSADFETGPTVLGIASISEHTFTVTIDGVPADAPETGEATPRLPAPHHRPHWGEEGVLPASMGSADYPTPVGTYSVLAKDESVVMDSSSVGIPIDDPDGYRFSVDHAVRISRRGLYVHSAPWALRSLGLENISHGCIGLSPVDAEWYFDTATVGDPVIVRK